MIWKQKEENTGGVMYIIEYGMEKIILKLSHFLILNEELLRNGKITWKQKLKQTHLNNINITLNFPTLEFDISCSIGRKAGISE